MAGTINKVILVGHLGQNPDIRVFQDGGRMATMSVATSESWKDKQSGERKERTEWHRVVVTNEALVKIIEQYVKKGDKIYIEGQNQTRKWTDKDGTERYVTEVHVKPFRGDLQMLTGKFGTAPPPYNPADDPQNQGRSPATQDNYTRDDFEDEIPF